MLQALYGIRSERALCEHLGYNMRYRWFVGLAIDSEVWDHSSFTRNGPGPGPRPPRRPATRPATPGLRARRGRPSGIRRRPVADRIAQHCASPCCNVVLCRYANFAIWPMPTNNCTPGSWRRLAIARMAPRVTCHCSGLPLTIECRK